jgi:cobalamin biosynthetic protein CobC
LHGGDLKAAEDRWGRPADGWLDLSTGINPWSYPLPHFPAEAWTRLPGHAEEEAVLAAAGHAYGVGIDRIVAGPGSSALIQALAYSQARSRVEIVSPTYCEHARAWRAAGHDVSEVADCPRDGDVVVVVNPNNPDGRFFPPGQLTDLAEHCRLLVVDEAFADVHPDLSVADKAGGRLVVLRSFGKFFGLAGVRLGFALADPDLAGALRDRLGPWAVSGPALAVAAKALADDDWGKATRAHLQNMADRLDRVLEQGGLQVMGGTSLFRLGRHPEAATVYDRLGRHGILVRAFATHPDRLRFGLPASEKGLERLASALAGA